jgi:apolipoprotein N-acyltransferase
LAPAIVAVASSASTSPVKHAASLGFVMGLVYFGGTLYWVVEVMHRYGELSWFLAAPIGLLLVSYLAIYCALWAVLLRSAVRRMGVGGVWLAPVFWVALEWVRASIGGGFPWALLGSSQASVLPIVQLASVTGVFGLSALVALVSTAAAMFSVTGRRSHRVAVAGIAVLVVVVGVTGALRIAAGRWTSSGAPIRVGLVQGSVEQDQKYDLRFRDAIMDRYLSLSRQVVGAGATIVLWPEASTPFYFDVDAALAGPIRRLAQETHTPFIVGTDAYEPPSKEHPERFFNAAVLVGSNGRSIQSYRKMHLVPFGEFVPFKSLLFFVGPLIQAVSDFSPGEEPVVFNADGRRVSVAICYEAIYPTVARAFVERGSQLLATITNDAWFGWSSAASQHFEQAGLRAVEEGRYVVRAANTGISGAIDPYGRVLARTGMFQPVAIAVDVRLINERTIYSRVGDVMAWAAVAATMLFVVAGVARRSGRRS